MAIPAGETPPVVWSITANGQTKTLAEWGISNAQIDFVSQAQDELTFDTPGANIDSADIFNYHDTVTLLRNGLRYFEGVVVETPTSGDSKQESRSYVVAGPWWYLDNLVFQLTWNLYTRQGNNPWVITPEYSSQLILGYNFYGANITTAQQVQDVLDYAIAQGVPLQKSNAEILPDKASAPPHIYPPPDEVRDITCAEAIRKMLRWHPDAVTWFDYSTSPPKLRIKSAEQLAVVSLGIPPTTGSQFGQTWRVNKLPSIRPRYDLVRDHVALRFISKGSVNGQEQLQSWTEVYPPGTTGREISALMLTLDLQGTRVTTVSQFVNSALIGVDVLLDSLAFWQAKQIELADPRIDQASIVGPTEVSRSGVLGLPYLLLDGSLAEWMLDGSTPALQEEETIAANFKFSFYDVNVNGSQNATNEVKRIGPKLYAIKVRTTNLPPDTYSKVTSAEAGDVVPIGLAQYLYNATHPLFHEGSVQLVAQECEGDVGLGNRLNVTGGQAAWATMNALVQRRRDMLEDATTDLFFGPPKHLTAGDIVDLLKNNRNRRRYTSGTSRSTGAAETAGEVELPRWGAQGDTNQGETPLSLLTIKKPGTDDYHKIDGDAGRVTLKAPNKTTTLDWRAPAVTIVSDTDGVLSIIAAGKGVNIQTAACIGGSAPRILTVREVGVCVLVGGVQTQKKMLVIASDIY